jgi:hypothetical protein
MSYILPEVNRLVVFFAKPKLDRHRSTVSPAGPTIGLHLYGRHTTARTKIHLKDYLPNK